MMTSKIYQRGKETLLAACDIDLLDQTFRSKGLKIQVSRSFYEGDDCTEERLVNQLAISTIANLVGKKTVDIAVRHGFVDPRCVLVIGGVPHAQMARMI